MPEELRSEQRLTRRASIDGGVLDVYFLLQQVGTLGERFLDGVFEGGRLDRFGRIGMIERNDFDVNQGR